ncbi:MAG: serine protease [Oligoflexales bacterium]
MLKRQKKIIHSIGIFLYACFMILSCESDDSGNTTMPTADPSPDWHDTCENIALAEGKLGLSALYDEEGNKIPDSEVNSDAVAWTVLTSESHSSYSGVGRYGNCTATLIETNGGSNSPAYVLTNGHCVGVGLLSASGVTIDQEANSLKKMYFKYYVENGTQDYIVVDNKTIKFASMDGTDVAVVELDTTLSELKNQGITPFSLSSTKPSPCTQARNVGVPLSDVEVLGLRFSDCYIGDEVALNEGDYSFSQSIRHRCSIVGGNSGSPIFNRQEGTIIGVVNTAVNDSPGGAKACSLNRPCELNSDGTNSVEPKENYGQYVDFLAGCFLEGVFDLDLGTCEINQKFSI